jgi:polysaccharide pyruvyl transferase WcaK-like protein
MRVYLPYHLGSGNRGCEGIARGVQKVFGLRPNEIVLSEISDYDLESDRRLGLGEVATLWYRGSTASEVLRNACRATNRLGLHWPYQKYLSVHQLPGIGHGDAMFITGGDIYCYPGQHVLPNLMVERARERGAKTVLYGASLERSLMGSELVHGLRRYDSIVTRESISSETLRDLGIPHKLLPDPAFSLEPKEWELPRLFDGDVVGINMSDFTNASPLFEECADRLIRHIIAQGYTVCLIPHVFWRGQDDRVTLGSYANRYGERVTLLDSEGLSYLEIRYLISRCRYFIGSRTHSVISAYATHTPCIALGYSVKSRGIAQDLGMPEHTVINSKAVSNRDSLVVAFESLVSDAEHGRLEYDKVDECKTLAMSGRAAVYSDLGLE